MMNICEIGKSEHRGGPLNLPGIRLTPGLHKTLG